MAKFLQLAAGALASAFVAQTVGAATLFLEYNANNAIGSGTAFTVPNSASPTSTSPIPAALTPSAGQNLDATYAVPVLFQNGGLRNGKYIRFTGYGVLGSSGEGGSQFNVLPPPAPAASQLATGYTMEAFIQFLPNLGNKSNSGIGFSQGTSSENQFIYINGNGLNLDSQTTTFKQTPTTAFASVNNDLDPILRPGNVLNTSVIQFVKVVEAPTALDTDGTIRYSINGVQVATFNGPVRGDASDMYADRGENYGNVGISSREIRGLNYFGTRYYRGALTAAEVQASYLATIPEPSCVGLVAVGAMSLIGRRRRRNVR